MPTVIGVIPYAGTSFLIFETLKQKYEGKIFALIAAAVVTLAAFQKRQVTAIQMRFISFSSERALVFVAKLAAIR